MSLISRRSLTEIYDIDSKPSKRIIKQTSNLQYNSLRNSKKIEYKDILNKLIENDKKINDICNQRNINIYKNDNNDKTPIKDILKKNKLKKYPIIPRINLSSINNCNIRSINENKKEYKTENNEIKNKDEKLIKLNYKIIEFTSEDEQHPISNLKRGLQGDGWQSKRFSQYPQYIYIQFTQPALIKRIDLVLHEKNIPSIIKLYSYFPKRKDAELFNYQNVKYEYIGFIKTDSNEGSIYQTRESRKININCKSLFLKIELEKNHFNCYNLYNQIGLIKIEFIGEYLPYIKGDDKYNKLVLRKEIKENYLNIEDLDKICGPQLTELKKQMNYNIEKKNYDVSEEIINKIEKVRLYGKKILNLESERRIAITKEDFSKAIEIKNLVDKLKINIKNIDNLNSSRLSD